MAKITSILWAKKDIHPVVSTIELRVWGRGGTEHQAFYIGSGVNYQANGNLWIEVIYHVHGVPVFYTRNFLHTDPFRPLDVAAAEDRLNEIAAKGEGVFAFGDILPETRIALTLENHSHRNKPDEEVQSSADNQEESEIMQGLLDFLGLTPESLSSLDELAGDSESSADTPYVSAKLKISIDTGSVFGEASPGEQSVDLVLNTIKVEEGVRFMRELIQEIAAVEQGKHPDPASFPAGSSEWAFTHQLYQLAYDQMSVGYMEKYFDLPPLVETFDGWLNMLPSGGHILDAGCGHGQPVIARLLEQGFQVTGTDISPKMLQRARQQYPQARFLQTPTTLIDDQAEYDGACSFNSLLYLDPIDLLNSINRLHSALKPGGLLFLLAFDSGPDWRGVPLGFRLDHWMWSWHYGMEEAAALLEEHGYFEVLETRVVQRDEGEAARIERSPYGYVVIARKREREKA